MALSPIAFIAPNYRDFKSDWIKFYEPSTSTPKLIYLDSAGAVSVAKLQIDADGFISSAGGAIVMPYVSGSYDAYIFSTEADADANNTIGATRVADNILSAASTGVNIFDNVAEMKSSIGLNDSDTAICKRYYAGGELVGGLLFEIVAGGTGVDDGGSYIDLANGRQAQLITDGIVDVKQFGADGTYVNDKLALNNAITFAKKVIINTPLNASGIVLKSNLELLALTDCPIVGIAGEQIFDADNKNNITLRGLSIEGVYTSTPNLAEHAIKFTTCDNVLIEDCIIENVGGNGIQLEFCTNSLVENTHTNNTGFLGFIGVDCVNTHVTNISVTDSADPFSCQMKGCIDSGFSNISIIRPNSCGLIINTNTTSGLRPIDCYANNVFVKDSSLVAPLSGTKGYVLIQGMVRGDIRGVVCKDGTQSIEGFVVGDSCDGTKLSDISVTNIASIGMNVDGVDTKITVRNLSIEGCADRGLRQQGGKLRIIGGRIANNGTAAALPNILVQDAVSFYLTEVELETSLAGTTRYNIFLTAGTYKGKVTDCNFIRNNAADIFTTTGEFRTDTPNMDALNNTDCNIQVTAGWVAPWDIKEGYVLESSYARTSPPATGTWVVGDQIRRSNISAGGTQGWICTTVPNTFKEYGVISV